MAKTPPIPAFYSCYLLRSTIRHASLYIGSTPNPARRLRQHNGDAKGGAVRTSNNTLQPWEMTCLVTGFPSKVAALQFEWAWQNGHLTRHISLGSRITQAQTRERVSPRTGKVRKRGVRPRMGLGERLGNLGALLASRSFRRWPLRVTFYAEDVFKVWSKVAAGKVDSGIVVTMDRIGLGIHGVDVGYAGQKQHLEKSQKLLATENGKRCKVCKNALPTDGSMTLVCPTDGCESITHLECLAAHFRSQSTIEAFLPSEGTCPGCGTKHRWIDLVKEMTLRLRGEDEIAKLFKVRKARGQKAKQAQEEAPGSSGGESDEELGDAPPLDDHWHSISEDEPDATSVPQIRSEPSPTPRKAFVFPTYQEPVIEDSDWDDVDLIT